MAAFRSIASINYAQRANASVSVPSGVVDGDVLLLAFLTGRASSALDATAPAGWTLVSGFPTTSNDAGNFFVRTWLYSRVANSEPASYSFSHATVATEGVMVAVSGGSATAPVATINTGTGSTVTATGLTAGSGAYIGFIGRGWDFYGSSAAPTQTPPTLTERRDPTDGLIYVADGTLTDAGATGNKTHTNGNTGAFPWAGILVAVEPDVRKQLLMMGVN
ncbi:hypothetical protein [Methylibium sp.]|uniref:hypothetical protein n=1 Tax=Methylibium sp. TaxID=2067992 RepID=UPI0017DD78BB|nr:hypothetical protein [Methylibium sp.]MBA3588193.1 hypothetical protein [Methylibium sp.]